jgi:hypothetical protein
LTRVIDIRQTPQDGPAGPDQMSLGGACPATAMTVAMEGFRTPSG